MTDFLTTANLCDTNGRLGLSMLAQVARARVTPVKSPEQPSVAAKNAKQKTPATSGSGPAVQTACPVPASHIREVDPQTVVVEQLTQRLLKFQTGPTRAIVEEMLQWDKAMKYDTWDMFHCVRRLCEKLQQQHCETLAMVAMAMYQNLLVAQPDIKDPKSLPFLHHQIVLLQQFSLAARQRQYRVANELFKRVWTERTPRLFHYHGPLTIKLILMSLRHADSLQRSIVSANLGRVVGYYISTEFPTLHHIFNQLLATNAQLITAQPYVSLSVSHFLRGMGKTRSLNPQIQQRIQEFKRALETHRVPRRPPCHTRRPTNRKVIKSPTSTKRKRRRTQKSTVPPRLQTKKLRPNFTQPSSLERPTVIASLVNYYTPPQTQ